MKLILVLSVLISSLAFAQANQDNKLMGHDKEHQHVSKEMMDHAHDEAHHGKHDHKAHHPEHTDTKPNTAGKKK